jgi:hypothetical protein
MLVKKHRFTNRKPFDEAQTGKGWWEWGLFVVAQGDNLTPTLQEAELVTNVRPLSPLSCHPPDGLSAEILKHKAAVSNL